MVAVEFYVLYNIFLALAGAKVLLVKGIKKIGTFFGLDNVDRPDPSPDAGYDPHNPPQPRPQSNDPAPPQEDPAQDNLFPQNPRLRVNTAHRETVQEDFSPGHGPFGGGTPLRRQTYVTHNADGNLVVGAHTNPEPAVALNFMGLDLHQVTRIGRSMLTRRRRADPASPGGNNPDETQEHLALWARQDQTTARFLPTNPTAPNGRGAAGPAVNGRDDEILPDQDDSLSEGMPSPNDLFSPF